MKRVLFSIFIILFIVYHGVAQESITLRGEIINSDNETAVSFAHVGLCEKAIGTVSNEEHSLVRIGKAGRVRRMGRRPHVRGKAMNPNDHPHGGGEGKSSGGRTSVTPWGKPTLGYKTRGKKSSDKFIVRKRKSK